MNWLKWYLSVPLKLIARPIVRIAAIRACVRGALARFDLRNAAAWIAVFTGLAWLAVWLAADDGDRSRLTDAVRSYLTDDRQ